MQSVVTEPLPLRQYSGHLIKLHACLHYSRLKPLPLFVTQCCWFVTTSNCTCTKTLWCWHLVYCVTVIFDTRLFLGKIFVVFLPGPFISSSAAKIIWTANLNRPQWLKWKIWGEGTPFSACAPQPWGHGPSDVDAGEYSMPYLLATSDCRQLFCTDVPPTVPVHFFTNLELQERYLPINRGAERSSLACSQGTLTTGKAYSDTATIRYGIVYSARSRNFSMQCWYDISPDLFLFFKKTVANCYLFCCLFSPPGSWRQARRAIRVLLLFLIFYILQFNRFLLD